MRLRRVSPIAVLLSAACASVSLASPERDAAAKQFAPVEGKGVLYVVLNGGYMSSRALLQIFVDGRAVGSLTGWTFHQLVLDPGEHFVVASSPENERQVAVALEPGGVAFLGVTAAMGWSHGRVGDVQLLPPEKGKHDVGEARLAAGFSGF